MYYKYNIDYDVKLKQKLQTKWCPIHNLLWKYLYLISIKLLNEFENNFELNNRVSPTVQRNCILNLTLFWHYRKKLIKIYVYFLIHFIFDFTFKLSFRLSGTL